MKQEVLRIVHTMQLLGLPATKNAILSHFPVTQHRKVHECMHILMEEKTVFKRPEKDCLGNFIGTVHFINN